MVKRLKGKALVVKRAPVIPMVILASAVSMALFAPFLAPYSPTMGNLPDKLLPPSWMDGGRTEFLLGTDRLGRDILSRIIYGARASIAVAAAVTLVSGFVGTMAGVVAGYFGGKTDAIIMRLVDMVLSLPLVLIALALAIAIGPSIGNLILIISLLIWGPFARQARAETLSLRERDFVNLARIAGCSNFSIIRRHIIPNILNTIVVLASLQVGMIIVLEASLSFLGAGIPPPDPSWGKMVADGGALIGSAWWVSVFPGLAIFFTVMAGNLFGDWLRDFLDPKLRQV